MLQTVGMHCSGTVPLHMSMLDTHCSLSLHLKSSKRLFGGGKLILVNWQTTRSPKLFKKRLRRRRVSSPKRLCGKFSRRDLPISRAARASKSSRNQWQLWRCENTSTSLVLRLRCQLILAPCLTFSVFRRGKSIGPSTMPSASVAVGTKFAVRGQLDSTRQRRWHVVGLACVKLRRNSQSWLFGEPLEMRR